VSTSATHPLLAARLSETQTDVRSSTSESSPQGIANLTRRLAKGDEEAFREFHAEYFDRTYQFLLVVTRGQEQEAQEALQETLIRVARYARTFECEETFWCWIKAVARSVVRDGGRKHQRYAALLQAFALQKPVAEPEPRESSLRTALSEILDELSADDRRLIESKYLEGATVKELAARLGSTEKSVESKLLRLRQKLRGALLKKLQTP